MEDKQSELTGRAETTGGNPYVDAIAALYNAAVQMPPRHKKRRLSTTSDKERARWRKRNVMARASRRRNRQ